MPNAESRRTMPGPLEVVEIQRSFLRELGSVFWFIVNTFQESMERVQQGRAPFRAASFFRESVRAGVDSVPLVGLVCFFLGLTMALLTGYQLQRFGTERLIPGLVAIAFTRELGPLLTGIMVAARIGAAFTAELGTMQVNEEVEAVEAMGIGPLRFLAAPRMLALFLLTPCLSTVSNLAAVFASSLVCKAYFSIAFPYFLDLVKDSLLIRDIITGILKSFMFGLLIAAIACYRGLNVSGGAAGVGRGAAGRAGAAPGPRGCCAGGVRETHPRDRSCQRRLNRGRLPDQSSEPRHVEQDFLPADAHHARREVTGDGEKRIW